MATAWAQTGRVVLRKPATPGYGLEVGGKADNGRLQLRAVALNANRDSQRDRDIETLWCGEFQRLQALLAAQGGELSVERALGWGSGVEGDWRGGAAGDGGGGAAEGVVRGRLAPR